MEQWPLDKNGVPIPDKADRDLVGEVVSTVAEFVAEMPGQEGRALRALFGNNTVGNNLEKLCNSGRSMQQQMGAPVERSAQFCRLFDELQHIEVIGAKFLKLEMFHFQYNMHSNLARTKQVCVENLSI